MLVSSPYWLFKGIRERKYLHNFLQRLGLRMPAPVGSIRPLWIHAVSVGEVLAVKPLLSALREVRPELPEKPAPQGARAIAWAIGLYLALQVALPLRHHFIEGDVLWTEEGHRMSWRMMLRTRQGDTRFRVVDRATGANEPVRLDDYLTPEQQEKVMAYPDFIWQFAQHLKKKYAAEGKDVAVYARGRLRINRRPFFPFIDSSVDLASEPWDPYRHHRWILPPPPNWSEPQPELPQAP